MELTKKVLILVAFALIATYSQAQVAWGLRAGLGYTSSHSTAGVNTEGKGSFEIGPTVYYSFNEKVYLNSGLNLSIKRYGDSNDTNGEFLEEAQMPSTITYTSLELPVNLGTRFSLGNVSLYAQAGPFLGVKLGESLAGYSNLNYLNRLNYGLGAAVGVDIKKFKIELGYQYGLANIMSDKFWDDFYGNDLDEYFEDIDGAKVNLNTLFLGVSYVF
jgi:hypothetical protein